MQTYVSWVQNILLQRQQYAQLPEAEVKSKAEVWRQYDLKKQEHLYGFYRDALGQQQTVSNLYTCECTCVYVLLY